MIFFLPVHWPWSGGNRVLGEGGMGGTCQSGFLAWLTAGQWPSAGTERRSDLCAQTWHTNRFPVSVIQCMYFVFIYEQLELVQGQ